MSAGLLLCCMLRAAELTAAGLVAGHVVLVAAECRQLPAAAVHSLQHHITYHLYHSSITYRYSL